MATTLWCVKSGSHLWRMNTPEADNDYFLVYVVDTKKFLMGIANTRSKHTQYEDIDVASHEVGHVVNFLLKGNFNFIIGVMSPLLVVTSDHHAELRKLVHDTISKNCYNSIEGLARGNYHKYIQSNKDNTEKRRNTILRSIQFGITLLETGKFEYKPYWNGTEKGILGGLEILKAAYETSNLPEKPPEEPFREWLYNVRMDYLK